MSREHVIVGIDRSAPSRAALQWAARYARNGGHQLSAITVHPQWRPAFPADAGIANLPLTAAHEPADGENHTAMIELFASIQPEPDWLLEQIDGDPGPELIRAAQRADLLVVGTGEHTGIDRLLEGSVSRYCLRHATFAVAVIPAATD